MRNKFGSYLIQGLAINMLIFSGSSHAISLARFNVRLNDIAVGSETANLANKRAFVSLGKGFTAAKAFDPIFKFDTAGSFSFECGGEKMKSGQPCHFKAVKYGDSSEVIKVFNGSALVDTYTVVFTNLPVIQITTTGPIINTPKVRGDFRLMSGEFNQDTGKLPMGIETRGQTTQDFDKKSLGLKLGTAATPNKVKLLDMKAGDDWILDASYADTSFARNNISMDVFNEIHPNKDKARPNGQNAIQGQPVEAIVNNKYQGVYILNQHVGPTLLGLKLAAGSSIYKADFSVWHGKTVATSELFFPYKKGDIEFNFSQVYPNTKADFAPLKKLIDFVANSSELDFLVGIEKRIDFNSLADWYLLSKATQSSDTTSKNFFLAQNAGSSKFFVVPWDHNATFGLAWDGKADPTSTFFATVDNNLINRLLADPDTGFSELLKKRWAVLSKTSLSEKALLARFSQKQAILVRGGAAKRNAALWPQPGTGTITSGQPKGISNPTLSTTKYLTAFLKIRLPAMTNYINTLP